MRIVKYLPLLSLSLALTATANTVNVSSFDRDPADAAPAIQQAIDSGAAVVVVDQPREYPIGSTIRLRSDLELVLVPGARLVAKAGAFQDLNAVLLDAKGVSRLTIRGGKDSALMMRKSDYQNRKLYRPAEWRHTIRLLGCDQVVIRGLSIKSSGGDGVYLGRGKGTPMFCRKILIENCVIDDHHRQGVSVISAEEITIRDCVISNTKGAPPMAGIDFEPNTPNERIVNCRIERVKFINNAWSAVNFTVNTRNPVSAVIEECEIVCAPGAPAVSFCNIRPGKTSGLVTLNRLTVRECNGPAILFSNFGATNNFQVRFDRLNVTAAAKLRMPSAPVVFDQSATWSNAPGGVSFDRAIISGYGKQPPLELRSWNPVKLGPVSGSFTADGKTVVLTDYIAAHPEDFDKRVTSLYPVRASDFGPGEGVVKNAPSPLWRSDLSIYMLGRAGQTLEFELEHIAQGSGMPPKTWRYRITAPDGSRIALPDWTQDGKSRRYRRSYSFTAPVDGWYRLLLPSAPRTFTIFHPGTGLRWATGGEAAAHGVLNYIFLGKELPPGKVFDAYFEVPGDVAEFSVEAGGSNDEPVYFQILNADSRVVVEVPRLEAPRKFTLRRSPGRSEVWRLKFFQMTEDVGFRFSGNLPGIFADSPGNLPRLKPSTDGR